MELSIKATDLKPIAKALAAIAVPRSGILIFGYIKITAYKDEIVISATDHDMHVFFTLEGTTQEEGAALVGAKQLFALCQAASSDDEIIIKSNEMLVTLSVCGDQRIDCSDTPMPVEDFPPEKEIDAPLLELMPDDLRTLWCSVSWAMSNEETRYYLRGIFFHRTPEKKLCAVATDGHRLALRSMDFPKRTLQRCFRKAVPSKDTGNRGFIIPSAVVHLVLKHLPPKGTNAPVRIKMDETRINLEAGAFRVSGRLVDGTFPAYEKVLPKKLLKEAKLRAELPAGAISRVARTIKRLSGKRAAPAVRFDFSATSVDMTVDIAEKGGRIHSRLPVHNRGEDMTIGFNANYVLDILSSLGSETPVLLADDHQSAALFHGPDGTDHLCVLMPMRV